MTSLPKGWQLVSLGDVARWGSGGTPRAGNTLYYSGDIPWAVIGDLTDGPVAETASTISEVGLRESSAKMVPAGAVLVAMYGSIGKLGIAQKPMATNQAIAFAVPREDIVDVRYLFLYLQSQRWELIRAGKGATQQNIGQGILKSWPIPLPLVEEQRRIVDIVEDHLSRLDAAGAMVAASLGRLARLQQSLLESAIDAAKLDASTTVLRIAELALVGSGATPLKSRRDYYDGGVIPWVTSGDLSSSVIAVPTRHITDLALSETAVKLWPPGTLLVAMYGEGKTRGTTAELAISATTNQACAAIQLHPDFDYLRPWLKLVLEANYLSLRRLASGGVQPNLSLGVIKSMEIPVPTAARVDELLVDHAVTREAMSRLTQELNRLSHRLSSLKRSVLHSAFSGRLTGIAFETVPIEEVVSG